MKKQLWKAPIKPKMRKRNAPKILSNNEKNHRETDAGGEACNYKIHTAMRATPRHASTAEGTPRRAVAPTAT
jgi:hypothetical protein